MLDREKKMKKKKMMMMKYPVECIVEEYPQKISNKEDCPALDSLNRSIPSVSRMNETQS